MPQMDRFLAQFPHRWDSTSWRTVLARIRAMLVVLTSERRIVPSHQVELPMPDSDGRDHGGVNGGNPSETMPLFACDRMLVTNPIARRGTSGLREPLAACEPCDHPRQQTSACFFISPVPFFDQVGI